MVLLARQDFIGYVSSSTADVITKYACNPGQYASFPWLVDIANNFVKYRFTSLRYKYLSTSASALNSTNTALGTINLRWQPDPTIPTDTTVFAMQNSTNCKRQSPSSSIDYPVVLSGTGNYSRVVRSAAQPSGTDLRMYDYGYLEVGTTGSQAAAVIGELWVEYSVELMDPIYKQGLLGLTIRWGHYRNTVTGATNTLPLGWSNNIVDVNSPSNLALTFTHSGSPADTNRIALPEDIGFGRYIFNIRWYGSNAGPQVRPSLSYVNCTEVDLYSALASNGNTQELWVTVDVLGFGAALKLQGGGSTLLPADLTQIDLMACQIPNDET